MTKRSPQLTILATASVSGLFAVGLGAAWLAFHSELAQAQAADSLLDFVGAFLLFWVVRVAERPSDEGHPWGHGRAEPLGALAVAMLAAMLALRVGQGALEATLFGSEVRVDPLLLQVFLAKVVFKGAVVIFSRRASSPALRALSIDAQNDILVGLISVVGYFGMRAGYEGVDAILSMPVAAWIGWSGLNLARENIDLLMGKSPPSSRRAALLKLAETTPGVLGAHDLRAHHLGAQLSVNVHVAVNHELSLRAAHDIGELVRKRIEAQDDVSDCSVHIDPVELAKPSPEPS